MPNYGVSMVRIRRRCVHGVVFVYFYHCSVWCNMAKIIITPHFNFAVTYVVWFYTIYHNVIWLVLGLNIFQNFGLIFIVLGQNFKTLNWFFFVLSCYFDRFRYNYAGWTISWRPPVRTSREFFNHANASFFFLLWSYKSGHLFSIKEWKNSKKIVSTLTDCTFICH